MKCRGCGELIVVRKLDAAEPASPAAPPAPEETSKDDEILPIIKSETSGMDEFDLDSSPITIPPVKKKGTIVGQAVPPPPAPIKPPAKMDDPFADLSARKVAPVGKPQPPEPPQPPARGMQDLPAVKTKSLEQDFMLGKPEAPAPRPPRPAADLPGAKAGPPAKPQAPVIDNLPAPKAGSAADEFSLGGAAARAAAMDADLPAPRKTKGKEELDFADLPIPARPSAGKDARMIDLPVPKSKDLEAGFDAAFEKAALPSAPPHAPGKDYLDSKKTPLQVPTRNDTPIPPVLAPSSILPKAKETPKAIDEPFGGLNLPKKKTIPGGPLPQEHPGSGDDIFGSLEMPPKQAELPAPKRAAGTAPEPEELDMERSKKFLGSQAGGTTFGEIDLGEAPSGSKQGAEDEQRGKVDLPEKKRKHAMEAEALGEEALVDLDSRSVQDIERQRVKSKAAVKAGAVPAGWIVAKGRKGLAYILLLLIVAGGGVALWQTGTYKNIYKNFSKYVLGQDIDAYFAMRDRMVSDAGAKLKDDRYADYKQEIKKLKQVFDENQKDKYLAAYVSYLASSMELRFGKERAIEKLGEDLLNQVPSENDFPLTYMLATSSHKLLRKLETRQTLMALLAQQQQNPQDRDVLALAALGCLNALEGDKAVSLYKKLVALEGGSRRSRYGLIRATLIAGDFKTGDELLSKFIEANPDFIEARILKARRYVKLGSISQAEALIEGIRNEKKLDPFMEIPLKAIGGMIHLRSEQYQKAKAAFAEILKTEPMNMDALLGMAEVDLYEESPTRALGRYTLVLGVDPQNDEALFGTVQAQIQLSQFKEANASLTKLGTKYKEDHRLYFFLAQLAIGLGNDTEAEKQFKLAMEKKPIYLDSYLELASLYFKEGRNIDAIAVLEEARKNLPLTAKLLTAFARGRIGRGEYDKALEELGEAVKKDPEYIHAHFYLGVTHYHLKNYQEALAQLDIVAKTNPAYPSLVLYQGLIFEAKGDNEKALAYYNDAMKTNPDDENVLLRAVTIYVANGKYGQARTLVEKVLAKNPANSEGIYYLGRVLLGQNQNAEALHHFEKAIRLSPSSGLYYLWAGLASDVMGNFPDALQYSEKAIERDANLAEAYLLRGKLRVRMGIIKDGKADLKKALELNSNLNDAWGPIGLALEEERSFGEAINAYQKYLEKRPEDYEIHTRAGLILFDKGQVGEAQKHFKSAAEVAGQKAPESKWRFTSLYYLGMIEEKQGNTAKAVSYYEEYAKFAPTSSIDRDDVQARLEKLKPQ